MTARIDRQPAPRVWFVTGASRGLGSAIDTAALDAGDSVAVAARTAAPLRELAARYGDRVLPLPLDVRRAAPPARPAARAPAPDVEPGRAGRLPDHRPLQRQRVRAEGLSEALAQEAAPFGVHVTIVEPGGYWTDLYTSMRTATPLPAYAQLRAELERQWAEGSVDSDPRLAVDAVLRLVAGDDPPLRLVLGSLAYDLAVGLARQRVETWARWEPVSRAAERAVPMPTSGT